MEHTAPRFLFRFKIIHLCLLCLRTASLDLEPYLINMQNKYTRGWYNCLLCDINKWQVNIDITSRNNYLTSDGRNMPPYF